MSQNESLEKDDQNDSLGVGHRFIGRKSANMVFSYLTHFTLSDTWLHQTAPPPPKNKGTSMAGVECGGENVIRNEVREVTGSLII